MKIERITIFLILITCSISSWGQCLREEKDTLHIFFRQGYSIVDRSIRQNGQQIDSLRAVLLSIGDSAKPVKVNVEGFASPEGSTSCNKRLSFNRARRLIEALDVPMDFPDSIFNIVSNGVDWKGLRDCVAASDMTEKDEILYIIDKTPDWVIKGGKIVDSKKRQLANLHGGRPWRYMYEKFFPDLRRAEIEFVFQIERKEPKKIPIVSPGIQTRLPEISSSLNPCPEPVIQTEPAEEKHNLSIPFAIKTNLLYDLAITPNIGVEFYLGKGWTTDVNWGYAWWKHDPSHFYWRTYGGDIEIRKYFKNNYEEIPRSGHHLGLYGGIVTYDFEFGGGGYLGDKWSYHGGISYGYSLPVTRKLNIDFNLGLGYQGGEYKTYDPENGLYMWRSTRRRHWIGPTKLEISLIWLIGRDNYNRQKGGRK